MDFAEGLTGVIPRMAANSNLADRDNADQHFSKSRQSRFPIYELSHEGVPAKAVGVEPCPQNLRGFKSAFASIVPCDNFAPFLNKGDMIYLNPEELAYPGSLMLVYSKNSASYKDAIIGRVKRITPKSMILNISAVTSEEIEVQRNEIKTGYIIVGWVKTQTQPIHEGA